MPRLRVGRIGRDGNPEPAEPPSPTQHTPAAIAAPANIPNASRDDRDLIERVQARLISEMEEGGQQASQYNQRISTLVGEELERGGRLVPERERARIARLAQFELLGFGPLEELLADDSISEIMVNGPNQIWVERGGKIVESNVRFADEDHVRRIIDRIIAPLGRRCDETSPMVDARLPDGSRVNVIIPPLCLNGPTLTIRKFSKKPLKAQDLITRGSASAELVEFLRACVISRINVVVAGGTGTGKTTMLNVLSSFIPADERIITIENAAEIQLQQRHVVTLESRAANVEGRGEISMRDLVINSLRMRPDRIVVGECRAGETLDMLQAMNTGHDGSMTTLHANSPRDAIRRMETMVLMSGMDLPIRAIREQIASAVDLIVQLERMQDGSRRITQVTEIVGLENDVVAMQDLFVFQHQGMRDGKIAGKIIPTGLRPQFMDQIQQHNLSLSPQIFGSNGLPFKS
ncbi:MAG: CpaF family protein [Roseiflexaceae bacterium]|nr:CpaF family protein [Roseiflexaceae bacterium]